jgi:hypothetical protein
MKNIIETYGILTKKQPSEDINIDIQWVKAYLHVRFQSTISQ